MPTVRLSSENMGDASEAALSAGSRAAGFSGRRCRRWRRDMASKSKTVEMVANGDADMSAECYCLLDDCSGTRATVLSTHDTYDAALAASRRGGRGATQVALVYSDLGEPTRGERVWYCSRSALVTGRA
jgi:hypothetical protein